MSGVRTITKFNDAPAFINYRCAADLRKLVAISYAYKRHPGPTAVERHPHRGRLPILFLVSAQCCRGAAAIRRLARRTDSEPSALGVDIQLSVLSRDRLHQLRSSFAARVQIRIGRASCRERV